MFKPMFVVVAALSILQLTACNGQQGANNKESSMQSTLISTQSSEEKGTRVVKTPNGDVEVPTNPKRVIALYTNIGDMLALGVQPIAAVEYNINHPNYSEKMKGVFTLSNFEPETLMIQEPDLLLLTPDVDSEKMSKIAPTVVIPYINMTLDERVTLVGDVLNKQEEAKQILTDFHKKVEESKTALKQAGIMNKTISIFSPSDSGFLVYGDRWGYGGGVLYSELGFRAPEIVEKEIIGGDQWRDVSLEVLNEYAGDYIIFLGDLTSLKNNSVWESIPAVKEGRVIQFEFNSFIDSDITSSFVQLSLLTEALLNN